jgi:4'-phosphopantetheinyl transferase
MPIICFTKISEVQKSFKIEDLLPRLPSKLHHEIMSYQHARDQYAGLLGKLIIGQLLENFGYEQSVLSNLKKTDFGKPFIENTAHFNISHSFDLVIGVASTDFEVGIDAELLREVPIEEYKDCFIDREWEEIITASDPILMFFDFWTKKESFLKAEGTGFSTSPYEIGVANNWGKDMKSSRVRFFEKIEIDKAYMVSVCSPLLDQQYKIEKLSLL